MNINKTLKCAVCNTTKRRKQHAVPLSSRRQRCGQRKRPSQPLPTRWVVLSPERLRTHTLAPPFPAAAGTSMDTATETVRL